MLTIRQEKNEDINQIATVHTLAFKQDNEAKLINHIRSSEFFVPDLSIVAVANNIIVGHILFSEIILETKAETIMTLGLAPMAVLPKYQQKGIGSTLVRRGLEQCSKLNFKHVTVLGDPKFYRRFGFVTSKEKGISSPFPVPDHVFMVNELETDALKDITGKIIYPSTFTVVS